MVAEGCLVVSLSESEKIPDSFVQNVWSLVRLGVESFFIHIFDCFNEIRYGNKTEHYPQKNFGFTPSFQSETDEGPG
jgi:hypothetical protein